VSGDGYDELRQQAEHARLDAREARTVARRHAELIVARVDALCHGQLGAREGDAADPCLRLSADRYDAVRRDAERAWADAQTALDDAKTRAQALAALASAFRGGGASWRAIG
jgi:hypothetical protein